MTIRTEHLQTLFDVAVNSPYFGSGFLDSDEVTTLRAVAVMLGVDPAKATPDDFTSQYPHPFKFSEEDGDKCLASSHRCGKPTDDPIHQTETTR